MFDIIYTLSKLYYTTCIRLWVYFFYPKICKKEGKEGIVLNNIGERIKFARKQKGMTQEELGKVFGVSKSAIGKYEKGIVQNLKRSSLAKIAEVLEMNPVDLVIEENPIKSANQISEIFMDQELMDMISTYQSLDDDKKEQAKDFIYFLKGRS